MAEPAAARPAEGNDRSVGDLVSEAIKDLTQLVRYETDLARAELRADARRLGLSGALLAIAALAHVLLTSVRRRRRDLAILKTLGLRRAQLIQAVSWQATAMAAAALLLGMPLGLLAGRWTWTLFAASAGVSPAARIPVLLVLLVVPGTLAAAVLMASRPGWEAARIQPAVLLRGD